MIDDYNYYRFAYIISSIQKFHTFPFKGKKWLDLGCHDGSFAGILSTRGYSVTGIDVYVCDPKLRTEQSWEYLQCDLNIGRFPIGNNSIDVVSALELIEHIIDTDKFLSEVYRILKPGGLFVLTTPNICMLKNRFRIIAGCYPYGLEYRNIMHHVRLYNIHCLISQLRAHNFTILLARGEKLLPQRFLVFKWARKLSKFLARAFPTLCSNLFVIASVPKIKI